MFKQLKFDAINLSMNSNESANHDKLIMINLNDKPSERNIAIHKNTHGFELSLDAVYILIQLICSCLAGVYNEFLLKDTGAHINIYIQNIFMYLDSIVCNLILLILQGNVMTAFNGDSLKYIFTFNVIIIMINNAAIGIITSFFLKYLNSILKTFASALELLFTAVLCFLIFHIPIHLNTILSIGIVSFAIYLYSLSPVVNKLAKFDRKITNDEQTVRLLRNGSETV